VFFQTAPFNATNLPGGVTCSSTLGSQCDANSADCLEHCVYLVAETSCFDAQIADAALEAILQVDLQQCSIPNQIEVLTTTTREVPCNADTFNPDPANECLVATLDEDNVLPNANFDKLDTAIQLVFGEGASVGFVCSIAESVANDDKPLPGRCCLDAPYSKTDPDTWGQPVC
jgi:hypothetical protein